ncbi:menaquinone-specific isochorismate synthase [Sinomonas atrocyanea]|uniref:isochorismate synthase n=1 Tax=Sinomonas atrocyanea TaxID=37927 RepID=UPI00278A5EE0|nr:isochorismate synthase [Sinomonas atrocyanea]MDP9885636.1 menaquinone-specific isochorismate synthase [Sinomonas atrocyanea]
MKHPLRALTVTLGPAALGATDLAAGLTDAQVQCWVRRGEGQIGFGEAARFTATGADRFIDAEAWWKQLTLEAEVVDRVGHPGTGLLAFGSFAFSRTSHFLSRLVVPELVIGIRDGAAWATLVTSDGTEPTDAALRAAVVRVLDPADGSGGQHEEGRTTPRAGSGADGAARGPVTLSPGSLGEQRWMDAVAAGVERIAAGELEKLVLARDIVVHRGSGIERHEVLRRLAASYQDTWVYGVDGLVGATPEMLIQVEGRTAQARVLAGTIDRRDANGQGLEYAERVLAGSPKQRHEHEIAIQSLTTALAPFSEAMNAHDEPFILELPNVYHLASDVKAELVDVEGHIPTSLALVNALHPTAAVCGTPTSVAGALIRELEALDRGPYAGPVGWLDAAGNGEWGIALRGGVIETPTSMRLYAGCGIVEASQPTAELAETWAKFRPMLEALGVER